VALLGGYLHIANEGQVLATYLDEVADLAVGVLDAGARIGYVDEGALGCLVVLALYSPAHRKHQVGCLLLDIVVEG
jgi:hypothetical protein